MSAATIDPDRLLAEGPQSLLERTLITDYLLSQGYLMSDLKELPRQVTKRLMSEACRFAALRLAEIEAKSKFLQKIRLPISLN
jgi:hypothetical protein